MLEKLAFLLAMIGYVGLAATAVGAAFGALRRNAWRAVAAVIVAHVCLIWAIRYEFQLSRATRNGYAGFLLFHSALLAIVASLLVSERWAHRLIWAAFFIVTAGAVGASFRYDEVAIYRIPVLASAIAGLTGVAIGWFKR